MTFFRQHPVREDALSAYVDSALSGAEQTRVAGHLETCERCRAAVAELRAVRSAVQELPRERAPRSFALRRADIETPRAAAPSGLLRASPMLGALATIALLAFFSLVGFDIAAGPSSNSSGSRSPGTTAAFQAADTSAKPAARQEAPPEVDGRDGEPQFGAGEPQSAATPGENTLAVDSPAATAPSREPARGAQATKVASLPATGPEVDAGTARDDDDRTGLRAAEAATAAVTLVAGGTFAFAWWRRRV